MACDIVVVGKALGGLDALTIALSGLLLGFLTPVAIVQHRGTWAGGDLRRVLQAYSALLIREPHDKELSLAGSVYLAAAGCHLLVERGSFALSTVAPVRFARPSIDVLFESAANAHAERVVGVILRGSGYDGARGLAAVKERGGFTIVQDPPAAESRGLPDAAVAAMAVDRVVSVAGIPQALADVRGALVKG